MKVKESDYMPCLFKNMLGIHENNNNNNNNNNKSVVEDCVKNDEGTIKGIEVYIVLELIEDAKIYTRYIAGCIIIDDNSLMKASTRYLHGDFQRNNFSYNWS
jgi:hypothetical protein